MNESWNKDVRGTQVLPLINSDADIIRCVAGPGSGKTFGLVRRVERILHPEALAVDGREVLVVAFNRVISRANCAKISTLGSRPLSASTTRSSAQSTRSVSK
jgi:hypothetical protein